MRTWANLLAVGLALSATPGAADDGAFFRSQVEPLLEKRCYECHSHRSGKMKGGLTLDSRSGWAEGGDRGPAIVPGEVEKSVLIRAIRHTDPDLKMPKQKLPEAEIVILEEWIKRGAADPRELKPTASESLTPDNWWSLRPLAKPAAPKGKVTHPIDAFVQASLKENKLSPSPEADRRTLIRRLYFDLLGLPPNVDDVDAFVKDRDPQAWAKLVDRVLASPRYGERWARHWLDTIHYADTHGFEHDSLRTNAWRYRDYVIDSFNRDTPWPRFIREQLAADAFFPDEPRLAVALGFLGAGPYDASAAGTAPQSFEYIDRDDLVTQTAAAFASTTANCARCHAHKFDPITQQDYFALQAVFAGIGKGDVSFDETREVASKRKRWQGLKTAADSGAREVLLAKENQTLVSNWETSWRSSKVWHPLEIGSLVSTEGADLTRLADGSVLSGGKRPDKETIVAITLPRLKQVTAVRLDVLPDDTLPLKGPGRADNGNFHLNELEVQVTRTNAPVERVKFSRSSSDFDQTDWTSAHAIDGNAKTAWAIHPKVGVAHHAVFEFAKPVQVETGTMLVLILKQTHGSSHILGRFRLSASDANGAVTVALTATAEEVLRIPAPERTPEQQLQLASVILRRIAEDELARLPAPLEVYAAASRAKNERGVITYAEPRVIRVLHRGELDKPRAEAPPGALSAVNTLKARFELSDAKNEAARRAALADWLADDQNPLSWRSIANRVWHYHFGRGLCDTPSDFGRMGGTPSHPELLDWLAADLREHGGSLKHLHRLICTSQTYRQTSENRKNCASIDPDNRLLWRMNNQRLDADSFRDAVLAVSGNLDLKTGGPGISQFKLGAAIQGTPALDYKAFDWSGTGANRRSIYRVVWRGIPDPFMEALDFPDAALLAPTRGFSASALQALSLLNNDFVLHYSSQFARRIENCGETPRENVRRVFREGFLREPTSAELTECTALAEKHGLAAVCRVIFNSNEFLFLN